MTLKELDASKHFKVCFYLVVKIPALLFRLPSPVLFTQLASSAKPARMDKLINFYPVTQF